MGDKRYRPKAKKRLKGTSRSRKLKATIKQRKKQRKKDLTLSKNLPKTLVL